MLEPMVPRPNQEQAIRQVLKDHSHICKAQVGAGKTLIGVEAALRSKAEVILIVAPLNTKSGWRDTFARQSQGSIAFAQIDGAKTGKLAFENYIARVPGAYFIGWERFRIFAWHKTLCPDFIIADEIHRAQNRKAKNWLMLNTTAKAGYKLALSATPAGNRMEGLWAPCKWLWPETKAFWPWVTDWMKTERDPYAGKKIMGERNPGSLWASLPSASSFASPYQDEPIIHTIEVDMTPAQQKLYDRFEREAVVWLDEHPLIAELPAVQQMRLRQITMAVPSIRWATVNHVDPDTGEKWSEEVEQVYFEDDAKSSKVDAALEVLGDLSAGGSTPPVLMFTHSRQFATILTKRLQAKGYRARQFIGGMTPHEREWKKENFGVEYDIMVATIATVGEGTDSLQNKAHIEFWLSVDDNRILNQQAKGRLSRPGQTETVQRYLFRARASVEVRQAGRLATDEALMNESLNHQEKAAA